MDALNNRQLVEWAINALGRALVISSVVPLLAVVVAVAAENSDFAWWGVLGPLAAGLYLMLSAAPFPIFDDDDE